GVAAGMTLLAVSQGMTFASLSMTATVTAMFQALVAVTFWQDWRRERGVARLSACAVFALSAGASMARAISVVPSLHLESGLVRANVYWLLVFIALNILQAGSLMFL